MKTLITDDEPAARAVLRKFLEPYYPAITISGEASGVKEAFAFIETHPIDLLLLDISMQDGSGFELLDKIPEIKFQVIFTTAHDGFAVKAFRYNALDYLLKPVDSDDFKLAIEKAQTQHTGNVYRQQISQLIQTSRTQVFDKITLVTSNGHVFTEIKDITRLETYGNYSFVFLLNGDRLLVSRNLKEFEELLPEPDFFRIHQSHIVNTTHVKKVVKDDGDFAIMHDGTTVPVSRRRKDDFLKILLGK